MNSLLYYRANNTASLIFNLSGAKDAEAIKMLFSDPEEGDRFNSLFTERSEDMIYFLTSERVTEHKEKLVGHYFILCFSINDGVQTISGINIELHFSRESASYSETLQIRHFECRNLATLCPEEGAEAVSVLPEEQLFKDFLHNSNDSVCTEEDFLLVFQQAGKERHSELLQSPEHFVFHYNPYLFRSEEGLRFNALSLHLDLDAGSRVYRPVVYVDSFLLTRNGLQIESATKLALLSPLQENPMTPPQAKEMIQRKLSIPFADGSDLLCSEDYQMIRNQTNLWTDAIRSYDPSCFIQEALDADSPNLLCDVIMPVKGYQGFQEQFDAMERMRALQPKKQGVHSLSTPYISLLSEDTAVAYYLDFGWTMMGEAFGNSGPRCPALPDVGRYIFKLKKKDDTWKVFELNWGPIIQYGMWFFDEDHSSQE